MKVAVITGGNKGLGLAQTQKFLEEGYQVFVVSRSEGELSNLTGDVHYYENDLSNWEDTNYIESIYNKVGSIDVLVNNAGMHLKKPIWDVTAEELGPVMDINVRAMFLACGRYVRCQKDQGGAIVNISSMGGLMALPSAAAYITSKTAVIGLTRSVAVDAAQFGIRCNAICPGFIDTDMTRAVLAKDPARRDKIEGRIPSGKFGYTQDVANGVFFLAGEDAAYINGVALPVDGGYSIGF